jgi:hypothetical protein
MSTITHLTMVQNSDITFDKQSGSVPVENMQRKILPNSFILLLLLTY